MADPAFVAVCVGEHVHVQGGNTHIHLVANVAALCVLFTHGQVGLLVSGQVGAGGEVLTTLIALVLGFSRRVLLVL